MLVRGQQQVTLPHASRLLVGRPPPIGRRVGGGFVSFPSTRTGFSSNSSRRTITRSNFPMTFFSPSPSTSLTLPFEASQTSLCATFCVWQISLHPLTDHSRRKTAPSNIHSASCFNCNLSDLIATSCPRQCFATFDKRLVIFLRSSFVTGKCGISVAVFNRKVFLWGVHCNPPLIGIWPSEQ